MHLSFGAKITGSKSLIANLKVNEGKIEEGLAEAALYVEGQAKRLCPVKTGYMRNHITHYRSDRLTQTIAVNTDYAIYQEFGDYAHKRGQSPFLRPAIWQNKATITNIVRRHLK